MSPKLEKSWGLIVKTVRKSMSLWSSGKSTSVSFGRRGFKPWPGHISSVINGFDETHAVLHKAPVSKLGRETPSRIRVWSLICNKKNVLFERHCHAAEKS
jgi:hypothetical protein